MHITFWSHILKEEIVVILHFIQIMLNNACNSLVYGPNVAYSMAIMRCASILFYGMKATLNTCHALFKKLIFDRLSILTDGLLMLFGPLALLINASESHFPLLARFSVNGKVPGTIASPLLPEQQLPSLPRLERLFCRSSERPERYKRVFN